ncbi:L-lactate dehydrogenase [Elusimicrobiota bacterium]
MVNQRSKIAVIGAGNVGSTFAYTLMMDGIAGEIVIIDTNKEKALAECMDLNHGLSFVEPTEIYHGDYDSCSDADIVVITAGAKQRTGETRMDLLGRNIKIMKAIIEQVIKYAKDPIILVVSNPVDILSFAAYKYSGFAHNRVIGSGTVIDSSRFRYMISRHCQVDSRNIHAYIIGEHGDSELPIWSNANIAGMLISEYCPVCARKCDYRTELGQIFEEVKNSAYKIIDAKGATYYAIGLALLRIVKAILRDENSILPVSALIDDYYGISDVYLGMPSVINSNGIKKTLKLQLSQQEQQDLRKSAQSLKNVIKDLGF